MPIDLHGLKRSVPHPQPPQRLESAVSVAYWQEKNTCCHPIATGDLIISGKCPVANAIEGPNQKIFTSLPSIIPIVRRLLVCKKNWQKVPDNVENMNPMNKRCLPLSCFLRVICLCFVVFTKWFGGQ